MCKAGGRTPQKTCSESIDSVGSMSTFGRWTFGLHRCLDSRSVGTTGSGCGRFPVSFLYTEANKLEAVDLKMKALFSSRLTFGKEANENLCCSSWLTARWDVWVATHIQSIQSLETRHNSNVFTEMILTKSRDLNINLTKKSFTNKHFSDPPCRDLAVHQMVQLVSVHCEAWYALWRYNVSWFHSQGFPFDSVRLDASHTAVRQNKTMFGSVKADERSCSFMSLWCKWCMCVCQTQTESQSWVCTSVGEMVVGFQSGVGRGERRRDGLWFPLSTSNLPCDTAATRRLCIVPRPRESRPLSVVEGTVWRGKRFQHFMNVFLKLIQFAGVKERCLKKV